MVCGASSARGPITFPKSEAYSTECAFSIFPLVILSFSILLFSVLERNDGKETGLGLIGL